MTPATAPYDQRSDGLDAVSVRLRDGDESPGVRQDSPEGHWRWSCNCGAYARGYQTQNRARNRYREHRKRCPLKLGMDWCWSQRLWRRMRP